MAIISVQGHVTMWDLKRGSERKTDIDHAEGGPLFTEGEINRWINGLWNHSSHGFLCEVQTTMSLRSGYRQESHNDAAYVNF